ncbi:hypothetical protein DFH27DRAFT_356715 [Peziza echinospora]|nr:hypothetical protein DFH27DRAFT_356715 [Peziza echinospora]
MTLWPFRKRAKTNSGDKIPTGAPIKSTRNDTLRQIKGKQPEVPRAVNPEFSQPPNPIQNIEGTTFLPQKQYHQGGFSSYFLEHSRTNESSGSSHLPHKPTLARKLSKRRPKDKSRSPENPYLTPPDSGAEGSSSPEMERSKFRFGRTPSKRQAKKGAFNWLGQERSTTFPPPARDVTSSLSSNSSLRPLKPLLKGFEKFTPRPKVLFGYETTTPSPANDDHRINTQSSSRRNRVVSDEELAACSTVDILADELDARGLRDVMERDRRRRERKKMAEHQRIEQKLTRRLMKQKAAEDSGEANYGVDMVGESSHHSAPRSNGAQTPLSWLRDPSVEDFLRAASRISEGHDNTAQPTAGPSTNEYDGFNFHQDHVPPTPEKSGRAKIASFLKKATASRLRKGEANGRIRAGESAFVSDSEGDDNYTIPQHNASEAPPLSVYRKSHEKSAHEDVTHEFSTSEPTRATRSGTSPQVQAPGDSPTIPDADEIHSSHPYTHFVEIVPEGRQVHSRASATNRYESRAVSPNAPSAISTLASIDSEGSWLSGKMSRQSYSRQSGNTSRQSGNMSRQSNTYPSSPPVASATSLRNHYELDDGEETEDDEYYGRIENGHLSSPTQIRLHDEEEVYGDRNHKTVLDLSDGEDDDPKTTRVRSAIAQSPKFHDPAWRISSRMGFVKYIGDGENEPPSPTAATFGEYDPPRIPSQNDYRRSIQHPFAEVGQNFVSPLENLAETRPRYTGTNS